MQKFLGMIAGLLGLLALLAAADAASAASASRVQATLIADKTAVSPGATVTVALKQTIAPGWHTYWLNPGDAGEPTSVQWKLPQGARVGELRWPVPHVIRIGQLVDYGYEGEVLLQADITLPQDLKADADIEAAAKWLVCKEICVPEETTLELRLPLLEAGLSPLLSPGATEIAAARATLPVPAPWPVRFEAGKNTLALIVDHFTERSDATLRFFPSQPDVINNAAPQTASIENGALFFRMQRSEAGAWPGPAVFDGVLVIDGRDGQRQGFQLSGAVTPSARADAQDKASPREVQAGQGVPGVASGFSQNGPSLGLALLFAFLGGLILNLMPCIFPVLSLKALSLAGERAAAERHLHGYAYLAGVLASFVLIGIVIVALRASGAAIGWGMQFQSPAFVLVMMALFLALGLHMSGVFTVGNRLASTGDRLTHVPGLAGYFFTGVLATIVATPCTAPYMGAAVTYAFTQPALQLFAVLVALGLGFALPILLLSLSPALGRWLPKPGSWMKTFKELMAFPLYATAGWLLWVLSLQQGGDGVLAGIVTLLGVAFAAWLFGSVQEPGRLRSVAAVAVAVAAILVGVASVSPGTGPVAASETSKGISALPGESFSTARLSELRQARKPVFVNMTAAWCITCLVNEGVALKSVRVAEAFKKRGITYLKGDWTNGDPEITAFLKSFDRVGVPLYVFYPVNGEPQILPQFLTERILLDGIGGTEMQQQTAQP